jgi:hypothetical protein
LSAGIVILYGMAGTLMVLALARRDGTFQKGLRRALEQFLSPATWAARRA